MRGLSGKIVFSRSFVRGLIYAAVAFVTANLLFDLYLSFGQPKGQSKTSVFPEGEIKTVSVTPVNHVNPQGLGSPLERNAVVPPADSRSKFIHRLYWELVRRNGSRSGKERIVFKTEDYAELKDIFDLGDLWGAYRNAAPRRAVHGIETKYDDQLILQQVWQDTALDIYPQLFKSNKRKTIVIRDDFSWWGYNGNENLTCPNDFDGKCKLREGRDLVGSHAVISVRDGFHRQEFYVGRDTFRIYFIQESPHASPETTLLRRNDLIASYWRGSEIPARYANWVYYDPTVRSKAQVRNYAAGKSRQAAVFMSNCMSMNKRLFYVEQLQKVIPVDVYGGCGNGNFVCERSEQQNCFAKLKKEYRFYLAFENANCRDYVTEKFFVNALTNDVIPVVLGAHRNDYLSLAPENSFILAEDYESPVELGNYLLYLSRNEEAYNAYFRWKGTGEFIGSDFFCRVCSLLWYADVNPPRRRRSVFFWQPESGQSTDPMCLAAGDQLWESPRNTSRITKIS